MKKQKKEKKDVQEKNTALSSRRKFIKGVGGGALAAAAAATLSSVACQSQAQGRKWSATYDWICVGSGLHGIQAAIQGQAQGMKTAILEKKDRIGGISVIGGTGLWVPGNYMMKEKGLTDSREDASQYLDYVSAGYSRPEYRAAFLDNANRMLDFLHQKIGIPYVLSMDGGELRKEFFQEAPGKRQGRLFRPGGFRNLEAVAASPFKLSRPSELFGFTTALNQLKGYEKVTGDGPARNNAHQLAVWKKRLGDATYERLIKENEAGVVEGRVVGGHLWHLLHAAMERGVEIRTGTMAEDLVVENGRVVGVTVRNKNGVEHLRATRGVLLALGGNPIRPMGDSLAWMLAARAGALMHSEPIVVPRITLQVPEDVMYDGSAVGRSVEIRQQPELRSSIVVNRFGQRFGNEWLFSEIGSKVNHFENWKTHRFQNVPNYMVFDHSVMELTTFGGYPPPENANIEWIAKGRTLREVAEKLKIDGRGLEATVARYNDFARRGKDEDFNRPRDMAPLEKPPFYGVKLVTPDPFEAAVFITYNTHGQALHYRTREPLGGLYTAGGIAANAPVFGVGYQSGHETATGFVFGMLAAEHAAKAAS
ncbi:MAG: FAD-binding protein [Acidobacteria bacterium]|nr:FAD-binding protein [Acidobacteriota bacterium]